MAKCKGCGAEINWIKLNGKIIPIDIKPKLVYVGCNAGYTNIIWELKQGYESHFATCPKADEFRKIKEVIK